MPVSPVRILPFLYHWLPEAAEEVSVTEPPWQKVVAPVVDIVGTAGGVFTVTKVASEMEEQLLASVTVTV